MRRFIKILSPLVVLEILSHDFVAILSREKIASRNCACCRCNKSLDRTTTNLVFLNLLRFNETDDRVTPLTVGIGVDQQYAVCGFQAESIVGSRNSPSATFPDDVRRRSSRRSRRFRFRFRFRDDRGFSRSDRVVPHGVADDRVDDGHVRQTTCSLFGDRILESLKPRFFGLAASLTPHHIH